MSAYEQYIAELRKVTETHKAKWHSLNFHECIDFFQIVTEIFKKSQSMEFETLPQDIKSNLIEMYAQIDEKQNQLIKQFNQKGE